MPTPHGIRILIFSDLHGDIKALERLVATEADIYIVAGDLSNFGKGMDKCARVMAPLRERAWLLPGNHETHEQTRRICDEFGFVDFHRQNRKVGSSTWAGLGYSNITPFNTPGEYTEEEIDEALNEIPKADQLYVVTHVPPAKSKLDEVGDGKHAGSPTLRRWIAKTEPLYLFCGHIHECEGRGDQIGKTKCFNVGKKGYLLELPMNSGPDQHENSTEGISTSSDAP